MKVTLTKEFKPYITLAEAPVVNQMIKDAKDEENAVHYAAMAAAFISGCNTVKVLEADASIAKNARISNYYSSDSGTLDIWLQFTAIIDHGFDGIYICGAYMSDIYNIGAIDRDEFISHCYIEKYARVSIRA